MQNSFQIENPNPSFLEMKRPVLSATIHPDLKRTLVAMSDRTGMSVSQVTDEVLYTGLIEMQEMDEFEEWGGVECNSPTPKYKRLRPSKTVPKGET